MEKYPSIIFEVGNKFIEHKLTIKANYNLVQVKVDTRKFLLESDMSNAILLEEALKILFLTLKNNQFKNIDEYIEFLDENEIDFETLRNKAREIVNNSLPDVKKESKLELELELDEDEKN